MRVSDLRLRFQEVFPGGATPMAVSAPGRVNLIGEHTDYNDGFVLPMAIDARLYLAGRLRPDREVHLYSLDYQERDQFSLDQIQSSSTRTWSNYIRGICLQFQQRGLDLRGMEMVLGGDVPRGAGLSSSAAVEMATSLLISNLHGFGLDRVEMVKMGQKAENEFVGVQCGIMDQFISMIGEKDHALFLDCRSLHYDLVPFSLKGYTVVVTESGVKRGLVDSEYNQRRQQCQQAVQSIGGVDSLRDLAPEHLPQINALPELLAKRARHVVTENQRVLDGVEALKRGDLVEFGRLMDLSHDSLRYDYQVSCRELDLLVEIARQIPGTLGSRMTGAGFGGCTVSLVADDQVGVFREKVLGQYPLKTGLTPTIYTFQASQGAREEL